MTDTPSPTGAGTGISTGLGSRVRDYAAANAHEIQAVVDTLDTQRDELDELVSLILHAKRVYLTGAGRSGLAGRAIAMRLMHTGLDAYVVGETSTPGIAEGDLLLAVTSSGRGTIANQARIADGAGASVAAITTRADGDLQALSSATIVLPIRSDVPTEQHAGSLFEQSALVIGDAVCRIVQDRLGVPTSVLDERHANLS